MEAIELGGRNDLGREAFEDGYGVREAFERAGLAHLMALSGQNVALLLVRTPVARWRAWLLLPALLGYWWLVGESPSVDRAGLMAGVVLLAAATGRGRVDVLGVVGLAGVASLLLHPGWLFDVGFQLSFLAVLGLTLTPRVAGRVPALAARPAWVRTVVYASAATLLAEAANLPVIVHVRYGAARRPAGEPRRGGDHGRAGAAGVLAGLLGPLAAPVNVLVGVLADALLTVANEVGRAPTLAWGSISPAGFMAYGVFALSGVLVLRRRVPPLALPAVMAALTLGTLLAAQLTPPRDITYLDVGQGDGTLIRVPGLRMLIDAAAAPAVITTWARRWSCRPCAPWASARWTSWWPRTPTRTT